jgi:hypothetical protein
MQHRKFYSKYFKGRNHMGVPDPDWMDNNNMKLKIEYEGSDWTQLAQSMV